jgi:hypothetical protein
MLSRVRTGMSNNEVTCAIPASRMSALIERLRAARAANNAVAAYAAEDSKRFAPELRRGAFYSRPGGKIAQLRWSSRPRTSPGGCRASSRRHAPRHLA